MKEKKKRFCLLSAHPLLPSTTTGPLCPALPALEQVFETDLELAAAAIGYRSPALGNNGQCSGQYATHTTDENGLPMSESKCPQCCSQHVKRRPMEHGLAARITMEKTGPGCMDKCVVHIIIIHRDMARAPCTYSCRQGRGGSPPTLRKNLRLESQGTQDPGDPGDQAAGCQTSLPLVETSITMVHHGGRGPNPPWAILT